jgi:hypothetical protein
MESVTLAIHNYHNWVFAFKTRKHGWHTENAANSRGIFPLPATAAWQSDSGSQTGFENCWAVAVNGCVWKWGLTRGNPKKGRHFSYWWWTIRFCGKTRFSDPVGLRPNRRRFFYARARMGTASDCVTKSLEEHLTKNSSKMNYNMASKQDLSSDLFVPLVKHPASS